MCNKNIFIIYRANIFFKFLIILWTVLSPLPVLLTPCMCADMDTTATARPIYCHCQMIVGSLNILLPPSVQLLVVVAAFWSFYSEYSFFCCCFTDHSLCYFAHADPNCLNLLCCLLMLLLLPPICCYFGFVSYFAGLL